MRRADKRMATQIYHVTIPPRVYTSTVMSDSVNFISAQSRIRSNHHVGFICVTCTTSLTSTSCNPCQGLWPSSFNRMRPLPSFFCNTALSTCKYTMMHCYPLLSYAAMNPHSSIFSSRQSGRFSIYALSDCLQKAGDSRCEFSVVTSRDFIQAFPRDKIWVRSSL